MATSSKAKVITIVAAALLVAGAGTAMLTTANAAPHPSKTAAAPATAVVTRTDLATSVTLQGAIGYAAEQPVVLSAGRVTWLPATGATVTQGQALLRVDDRPVTVFYGDTPLFRRLGTPGLAGRDVRVVADNLTALGFPIGAQPKAGSVVRVPADGGAPASTGGAGGSGSPAGTGGSAAGSSSYTLAKTDAVLTPALVTAIRRWQAAVGLPQNGVLTADDVVVRPGETRITAVKGRIGADASIPILTVASTTKVVTAQLKAGDADSIRTADAVTITLPNGATTMAKVASVGTVAATTQGDNSDDQPTLTATLTLDDPTAVATLDASPVQADFTGKVEKGVLAVPVGALLALSGGGYGLQLPNGSLLAVETGLFAKGLVEVSGDRVTAGLRVVTTS